MKLTRRTLLAAAPAAVVPAAVGATRQTLYSMVPDPLTGKHDGGRGLRVFLDGVEVPNVVHADTTRGFVVIHDMDLWDQVVETKAPVKLDCIPQRTLVGRVTVIESSPRGRGGAKV